MNLPGHSVFLQLGDRRKTI